MRSSSVPGPTAWRRRSCSRGRPVGARARGARHDRRRAAHGGADAPGFRHDTCSAIHPLGVASPFMRSVPLAEHGVEWIQPPSPLAHPLDDGTAVVLERSLAETGAGLGEDGGAVAAADRAARRRVRRDRRGTLAGPRPPRHPVHMARFGLSALRSASGLARSRFDGERARALFAGNAAHAMLPLEATRHGLVRADPRDARSLRRLAAPARRLAVDRRRARVVPPLARRRDRDGAPRSTSLDELRGAAGSCSST